MRHYFGDSGLPNCVPEMFREQLEREEREAELRWEREEIYAANRVKLQAAREAGNIILDFGGYDACRECKDADHDTQTFDEDDFCSVICRNPDCPEHERRRKQEEEERRPLTDDELGLVGEHVEAYFKAHLPKFTVLDVRRKSSNPNNNYLFMVLAESDDGTYAVWTCWNEKLQSMNHGHYGLKTLEDCDKVFDEYTTD